MSLARFEIIVAVDKNGGISKKGEIPWHCKSDITYFKQTTIGPKFVNSPKEQGLMINSNEMNYLIMGSKTFLSIPEHARPLSHRRTIVVSNTLNSTSFQSSVIVKSLGEALRVCGQNQSFGERKEKGLKYKVFVCGGSRLYKEAIDDYLYLCDMIHINEMKGDYECDNFFPLEQIKYMNFEYVSKVLNEEMYFRHVYKVDVEHEEYKYLGLLKDCINYGEPSTFSQSESGIKIFGISTTYDIRERLLAFTTKKLMIEKSIKMLLFLISGSTDAKSLSLKGVKSFDSTTSKFALEKKNLKYEEFDLGPYTGFQLRHFGVDYEGKNSSYQRKGYDQLATVIQNIKMTPHSQSHVLTGFSPLCLESCSLVPSNFSFIQFSISGNGEYLDVLVHQRVSELFYDLPYDVLQICLLANIVCQLTGYKPRKMIHNIGTAFISDKNIEKTKILLQRVPFPLPLLNFQDTEKIRTIDDFDESNFVINGYQSHASFISEDRSYE